MAIVFQSGNLWPALSARENVCSRCRLAGRRRNVGAAVERALDPFELQKRQLKPAGSLSGRRTTAGRDRGGRGAGAPLVVADEPTAELDARSEPIVLRALRRLRDELGSTVVVVTHSPRVADAVDRVIEIRDGRVAS